MSHRPSSYGIWFYCDCAPPTISLWLLLRLWMWGIFFGEFQCLPVDDCPAASCDSGVLARGSESMPFYSAILGSIPTCKILKWSYSAQLLLSFYSTTCHLLDLAKLLVKDVCFKTNTVDPWTKQGSRALTLHRVENPCIIYCQPLYLQFLHLRIQLTMDLVVL